MWTCKHCNKQFDDFNTSQKANHSRWCNDNPKRSEYRFDTQRMRNGITSDSIEKRSASIKQAHADGKYAGSALKSVATKKMRGNHLHTEETKQLIREKALASNHRRVLRSTRVYVCKDGSEVLLDSSWEEALAKRLDDLNISWIRPDPVVWLDNDGKPHNYFPDFYLTEHNIFLDPKNDVVYNMSLEKIECIMKVLPNLLIIRSLDDCKNFNLGLL